MRHFETLIIFALLIKRESNTSKIDKFVYFYYSLKLECVKDIITIIKINKMESTRDTVLNSCFNLMRRLSPNDITKNVAGLANLVQDENLKFELI